MKSKKTIYAIIFFNVLILFGCGSRTDEQQTEKAKFVKVEEVVDFQDNEKLIFNGVIKEKSLTTLSFRVGGPLENLNVKTGDYVNAGDIIAVLDKRDYQLQVQSTKAQYLQSMGEFERYKKLYEMNKTPANTFEKFQSGYLMAKSAYENAVNQLEDTDIKAPFSGYVHEKFVENFQTIEAGQPIISLIDLSQLEIVVSVPENQLLNVRKKKSAYLNVENAFVEMHPVEMLSVSEKAMKDGMYEVKFVMMNAKSLEVFPGMTAEVIVYLGINEGTVKIASSALFNRDDITYVWVLNPKTNIIKKRKIEINKALPEGNVEVKSGLKAGEIIVTAGVYSLDENQKVKPLKKSKTNVGGLL